MYDIVSFSVPAASLHGAVQVMSQRPSGLGSIQSLQALFLLLLAAQSQTAARRVPWTQKLG